MAYKWGLLTSLTNWDVWPNVCHWRESGMNDQNSFSCIGLLCRWDIYIYRYLSVYRVYTYYLIILWMCVKNVETSRILRHRHTQTHMIYIKKYTYQVYTCNPMKRHRNHYQLPLQPRQPCCQGLYTDNTSQHTIPWLRLWRNGILQWRT